MEKDLLRPRIKRDMLRYHQKQVLLRSQPEQSGAKHQVSRQIECAPSLLTRQAICFHFRFRASTDVNERQTDGIFLPDDLHRCTIHRSISGAQNLVPLEDGVECRLKRRHIQWTGHPQAFRYVVRRQILTISGRASMRP